MSIEKKPFKQTIIQEGVKTVSVTCELCHKCFEQAEEGYDKEINWDKGALPGMVESTSVYYRHHYVERDGGGQDDRKHLDICPVCFITKLIPWFEEQGGKVRIEELTH